MQGKALGLFLKGVFLFMAIPMKAFFTLFKQVLDCNEV